MILFADQGLVAMLILNSSTNLGNFKPKPISWFLAPLKQTNTSLSEFSNTFYWTPVGAMCAYRDGYTCDLWAANLCVNQLVHFIMSKQFFNMYNVFDILLSAKMSTFYVLDACDFFGCLFNVCH